MKSGKLLLFVLLGMLFSVAGVNVCSADIYVSSIYGSD